MKQLLYPKLFSTLKGYHRENFFSDLTAGIIVGIVALPLAIAFAIASGVSPDKGLVTAVIAGFLISLLGGSRVQIGGPTGAFVVIVYGIVQQHGIEGLILSTILAGILLIVMGLAGLGNVIKFIPHPVIVGFTSGIAVIIFSSQIKDFLGLQITTLPAEFWEKWAAYSDRMNTFNLYSFLIALGTLLLIGLWPKVSRKIPGSMIAIIIFSALVQIFHLPVETIGSRFGDLPHALPAIHIPDIHLSTLSHLIKPAFTIAVLGAIESLLSAVVAGRHDRGTAPFQYGVDRAGNSQYFFGSFRRDSGNRRYCTYCDQY